MPRLQKCLQQLKRPQIFLPWFALAILSIYAFDLNIAIYCKTQLAPDIIKLATIITHAGERYPYIIAAFVCFLYFRFISKNKQYARFALFVFLSVVFSGLICDLIKIITGRARPSQFFKHDLFGFYFFQLKSNMWSFPSGHTTTVVSLATAFSLVFPRWAFVWLAFFLLIACTRVIVSAHFPSDVVIGAYLGALVTSYLHDKFYRRHDE